MCDLGGALGKMIEVMGALSDLALHAIIGKHTSIPKLQGESLLEGFMSH